MKQFKMKSFEINTNSANIVFCCDYFSNYINRHLNRLRFQKWLLQGLLLASFLFVGFTQANLSASLELEGRNVLEKEAASPYNEGWDNALTLHEVGLSLYKVFADTKGDRLVLFADAESKANFKYNEIHEAYGRYKGPMGKWNLTLGRYAVPFGLNCHTSTFGRLLDFPSSNLRGFHSDNGMMASGALDHFDYSLSVSQGIGSHAQWDWPGPGLVSGRVSKNWGETEEFNSGLSVSMGKLPNTHEGATGGEHVHGPSNMGGEQRIDKYQNRVALDFTILFNSHSIMTELTQNLVSSLEFPISGMYLQWDYMISAKWEAQTVLSWLGSDYSTAQVVTGLAHKTPWFTWKGSVHYANNTKTEGNDTHIYGVTFQILRVFAANW